MQTIRRIQLTKKQKAFIDASQDEVLFGGAAGGGKSYAQLIDALYYAIQYPRSKQLILRRTYPELEKSLIRVSLGLFPKELYRYNADHTALVKYKINYFLEQLRINYHITAKDTEKDFADVLSSKSGVDFDDCDKLVTWLNMYRNKNYHDKEDFIKIQSLIESFNRKSNIHGRESGK